MVKRVRNSDRLQKKRELKQKLENDSKLKLKQKQKDDEEYINQNVSEDFCFVCKDGGLLIVCDHKNCVKAYHPHCVGQEDASEETDAQWICGWHSCFMCKRPPKYQCFCCPNAVCQSCIKDASFARLRGGKGFCSNCLNIALLGEEGLEVDSDGEKVDFKDQETYEGLFKEYWDIVKEKEGLTLDDLHVADVQIKKGENGKAQSHKPQSDSDEYIKQEDKKEESSSEDLGSDKSDNDDAVQPQPVIVTNNKKRPKRTPRKKPGSSRIEYVGWASKSLLEFLAEIGVDSSKKLSQNHVTSLIVNYVQENKLYHPEKRKMVVCDERLQALMKRKTISVYKINDCIEAHFLENVEQSEDEGYSSEGEENTASLPAKKQAWWKSSGSFQNKGSFMEKYQSKEVVPEEPKKIDPPVVKVVYSEFAFIGLQNMKLVYLKKSLVENLLEKYETFENKIIGSYVKVKSEPIDHKCPYQLLPVTGINEISGYETKRVLLEVSNVPDGVPMSMLSNDDLSEEECKGLLQKIESDIIPRPTVVELEKKAKELHEDITKHAIARELSVLKNRIDQANEKGRRAELQDYRRRRDLLQSEEEQFRLLNEFPKVTADVIEIKHGSEDAADNNDTGISSSSNPSEMSEDGLKIPA